MDDVKFLVKSKLWIGNLKTIRILSQEIRMEFGMENCATLVMNKAKRETMEGKDPSNQENREILGDKGNYKYLEILEADTFK